MFAQAKTLRAIGDGASIAKAKELEKTFSNQNPATNEEFGWLEEYARRENELHSWDGDLFSDDQMTIETLGSQW